MADRWKCARCLALDLGIVLAALLASANVFGQSKNLAPGFDSLPRNARIVLMPVDIELFSRSAGGVPEPRADWTDAANKHFKAALLAKKDSLGATSVEWTAKEDEAVDEINALHAAIAEAIQFHHFGDSSFNLPTKDGKLDWSMGEAVAPIREKTGADYALFTWLRDYYASGERIATIIFMALLTGGRTVMSGGVQVGYASLVDLKTGQVLWFNRLARLSGDLREPAKAAETLEALLENFPRTP